MTGLFKPLFVMPVFLLLLFSASHAVPAIFPDWITVETNNDTHFLIDITSMEQEENNIGYTLRLLRSDNSFADARLLLDCVRRKHKIAAISEFSDSGKLIARYDNSTYLLDIKGENIFNVLLGASCNQGKARIPALDRKQ
ncbi:MAG: hypothetical protein EPN22_05860 [Nitrospirae bacterium]|nr:MAG: hypothetical protein EPN22_05860 [Nitrospirota bacterium]